MSWSKCLCLHMSRVRIQGLPGSPHCTVWDYLSLNLEQDSHTKLVTWCFLWWNCIFVNINNKPLCIILHRPGDIQLVLFSVENFSLNSALDSWGDSPAGYPDMLHFSGRLADAILLVACLRQLVHILWEFSHAWSSRSRAVV